MDYSELIVESFNTLVLNKMRTSLAALGIVIGIGSVIALLSLGQATQQQIQSQIQSLGANLLTVIPSAPVSGGVRGASGGSDTLTNADAVAIASNPQITTIADVSPEVSSRMQVTTGQTNTNVQIEGVTNTYTIVHKVSISDGTFISKQEGTNLSRVAVLGPQVASTLFPNGNNPVGQMIRINGQDFTVIGITVSKGGTGFQNQDNMVFVPLLTAQKLLFGINYLNTISLAAKNPQVMTEAENQVGYLLLSRHKITSPTQADFTIFSQQDVLNTANQTTSTFTSLLSGIAAISLIVGGIGIMNIMLVTVTERIREIGLRKALGAKKSIITAQFLIESLILTIIGGIVGMFVGIAASFIIANLSSIPFLVSPSAIILSLVVSAAIGIIFGWYPARRAASLQPIEALRYE